MGLSCSTRVRLIQTLLRRARVKATVVPSQSRVCYRKRREHALRLSILMQSVSPCWSESIPHPCGLFHKYGVSENIHYFTNTLEVPQQCNIFKTWPKFDSFFENIIFL